MEWEYFKDNICTDRPVAYTSINGRRIFASLVHACEYFEENYYEQKSKIVTKLEF